VFCRTQPRCAQARRSSEKAAWHAAFLHLELQRKLPQRQAAAVDKFSVSAAAAALSRVKTGLARALPLDSQRRRAGDAAAPASMKKAA